MHVKRENTGENSSTCILERRITKHRDLQKATETSRPHSHGPTHTRTRMAFTHLQELSQDTHDKIKDTNICYHNIAMKTYGLTTTPSSAAGNVGGGRRASGYGLQRVGRSELTKAGPVAQHLVLWLLFLLISRNFGCPCYSGVVTTYYYYYY